jgi:elongation factor 1 alpha-like protein
VLGLTYLSIHAAGRSKTTPNAKSATKTKTAANGEVEAPTADIHKLEISKPTTPPPKSKGLDVVKEFENSKNKRSASFVVVGM